MKNLPSKIESKSLIAKAFHDKNKLKSLKQFMMINGAKGCGESTWTQYSPATCVAVVSRCSRNYCKKSFFIFSAIKIMKNIQVPLIKTN